MYYVGDVVFIIENNRKVQKVEILKISYGFYTVCVLKTGAVLRLREHRLYKTEDEAIKALL